MLQLPLVRPYDWPLALRMIGAHAVSAGERLAADGVSWTRLLPGPGGPQAVTVRPAGDHLEVDADAADEELVGRVRHWLDLDLDPAVPAARFGADPLLGPLVRARPGLRRIRYPTSYEAVVSTVLGQQVSLAAARTFTGRLVTAYGVAGPHGLRAFPAPERVAATPVEDLRSALGVTGSRARTVHAVSALFADTGDWPVPLPAAAWDDHAARLLALPGIGPWTVAYLRLRLFGDPDALPVGDLVLRRALGATRDKEVQTAAEIWRPDRSYATFQLWASTSW